jgi:hypothetical protein
LDSNTATLATSAVGRNAAYQADPGRDQADDARDPGDGAAPSIFASARKQSRRNGTS